jgi:hypothetical protein
MKIIHCMCRKVGMLASVCAFLVPAAASPAMAATTRVPHYPPSVPPAHLPAPIHAVTAAGMLGWQVTLIAAGAAVLAAVLAVTADRARYARRRITAPGL